MLLPQKKQKKKKTLWRTPSKHFIKNLQLGLLQKALSPWPRRSAPLLEINCGPGDFLPLLWQSGFDIIAVEADPALRILAETKKLYGLEFYSAADDDLPFMEDSFDWAILHLRNRETLLPSINEAVRVSKRGIMLTFWNKTSLPAMFERLHFNKPVIPENPISWGSVWSKLKALNIGRVTTLSVLSAPAFTWNVRCPISSINKWFSSMPVGAWCIIRLDLGIFTPFTALPLRLGKKLQPQEPAMEYINKNLTATEKKQK